MKTTQRWLYPEVFLRGGSFKTRGGRVFVARTTRNDKNSSSPAAALWEYPNSVQRELTITWTNINGFWAVRLIRGVFRSIRGVNDESSSSRPTGIDWAVSDGAVWPQVQRRRVRCVCPDQLQDRFVFIKVKVFLCCLFCSCALAISCSNTCFQDVFFFFL